MEPLAIDAGSPVPPFEQLRAHIAGQVARGELAPGTRLGTVRQVAADLGLAVNTVARAYRELEADGVVVTRGRHGTFVASALVDGPSDTGAAAVEAATTFVRSTRRLGLSLPEAVRLVEQQWS